MEIYCSILSWLILMYFYYFFDNILNFQILNNFIFSKTFKVEYQMKKMKKSHEKI